MCIRDRRNAARRLTQLFLQGLGEGERRDARGRVAGMDARLLDVLQYAPDVDVLTVAQGVDVALIRTCLLYTSRCV